MVFGGFTSALRRLTLVALALGVVSFGTASTAWAQAEQKDDFKFSSAAGVSIWQIKSDKVADFESVWTAVLAKLAASDKPELKELGTSLKIYKAATPAGPEGQAYFFVSDPASKDLSYSLTFFLYGPNNLFTRAEADLMFPKVNDAVLALSVLPLAKLQ